MAYLKFKVQDNAYWNLLSGISASATTINLETGDGDRFPADNFVATFVEYTTTGDDTTPILWQEKILVTARSADTLTVTRGYDGSTPRSFNAWDNIYLNVTSIIIEDIQDEVTRLETDKLDVSDENQVSEKTDETQPEIVPSIKDINNEQVITRLTFNDIDSVMDQDTNEIKNIEAPKTIERLEEISTSRSIQRRLEEEADDDSTNRLRIHSDPIDLSGFDVLDEQENKKASEEFVLNDVEELF